LAQWTQDRHHAQMFSGGYCNVDVEGIAGMNDRTIGRACD
jgi:hypothetical protein